MFSRQFLVIGVQFGFLPFFLAQPVIIPVHSFGCDIPKGFSWVTPDQYQDGTFNLGPGRFLPHII